MFNTPLEMAPLTPTKAGYFLLPLLCLPFLAMGAQYVGTEHDDALYILGSHALALGNYTQWFLPGAPRFVNGPPGLPALLLPVTVFAPDNLFLYQLLMAAVASMTIFFYWRVLRGMFAWPTALILTALLAGNPLFLSRAGTVMPEIPALALGLFLWGKHKSLSGWALGGWLLSAYLIRPASVALWVTLWGCLAMDRQWKKIGQSLLLPVLGFLIWRWWSQPAGGVQETNELLASYRWGPDFFKNLFEIVRTNAAGMIRVTGQTLLPMALAKTPFAFVWGLALWAVAGAGLAKKHLLFPLFYGIAHIAMHLFWPWWFDRYFVLLIPVLGVGLASAGDAPGKKRLTSIVLLLLFCAIFFGQSIRWFGPPAVDRHQQSHEWIRTQTPPQALCASLFYGSDVLHTGRIFVPLWEAKDAASFHSGAIQRRVQFIFLDNSKEDFGNSLRDNPAQDFKTNVGRWLADPAYFRLLYDDPAGTIYAPHRPAQIEKS